jgi:hypothetical protein
VLTDVSEVRAAFIIRAVIALMMEVVHTSETSVNTNFTRRYIPEDSLNFKNGMFRNINTCHQACWNDLNKGHALDSSGSGWWSGEGLFWTF